jgi:hypothetical protein
MKKLFLIFLLIITALTMANGQFTKLGGGVAISSGFPFQQNTSLDYRSGTIAGSLKGIYEISALFHISPSLSVFYPHITRNQSGKLSVSSTMFDVNGHFVFTSLDNFKFYGLAGLDILFTRFKRATTGLPIFKVTDNAIGLNIGAGSYMKLTGTFDIYGEVKYIVSHYDQFMVNAGILITIDRNKKHGNS